MSSGAFQPSDVFVEREAAEPSGRDWAGIGFGLAGAFAVIFLYIVGVWTIVVLAEALA